MSKVLTRIFASTPAAILVTLGGIGWLFHIDGAGILLALGVILQLIWLVR